MPFLFSEEAGSVPAARGLAACRRTRSGCRAVHSSEFPHGDPLPPGIPNGEMWSLVLGRLATLSPETLFAQPRLLQSSCKEPSPSRKESHLDAIIKKYSAFRLRESCCRH